MTSVLILQPGPGRLEVINTNLGCDAQRDGDDDAQGDGDGAGDGYCDGDDVVNDCKTMSILVYSCRSR